jgi:Domain of unknown function (DUF4397)
MFRLLKALPLTLALAALSFFATSCGSSSQSQIRVVQAISDETTALDVDVNGTKITTAPLAFDGVQPTPPAYTKVASGSDTLEAFDTGTTTPVINSTNASLSGSSQYTVLLTGFLNGTGPNAPAFNLITDNNAAPTSGNVEIRIIDGSANTPQGGFNVYIVPQGANIGTLTPQISGLLIGQASLYQTLNITGNVYEVIVTPNGTQNPYINQTYTIPTGSIRTFVIVDNQGGGGGVPSQIPLELNDLN